MKRLASWAAVDEFNRPNLDYAVAVRRVESYCFGIDDDLTHQDGLHEPIS